MKQLKHTVRNIISMKQNALFNLIGLTIGLSSFTLIAIWTWSHWSYDKFHEGYEQVYLVHSNDTVFNDNDVVMPFPMAEFLRERYPEMEHTATYTFWPDRSKIQIGEHLYYEEITATEKQVFDILDFDFISQNGELFSNPSDIAISASVAKKFFGTTACIGENILIMDSIQGTIAAVYNDFPQNSTFKPAMMCSYNLNEKAFKYCTGWNSYCYYVLTKIPVNADIAKLGRQITQTLVKEHETEEIFSLYPLEKVHLEHPGEASMKKHLIMVFFSGLLVLLVSCINFINLLTTGFIKKSGQSSIRKILGASLSNIIKSSLLETALYVFAALCLSILISMALIPVMSQKLDIDFRELFGVSGLIGIHLAAAIVVFLLVAVYPAFFYASKFTRQKSLAVSVKTSKLPHAGKAFVIVQFAAAIFIGIVAFVMQRQLSHAINTDKGYNAENVIYTECWDYPFRQNREAIKYFLKHNPDVESFSIAESGFAGMSSRTTGFTHPEWTDEQNETYKAMFRCDENLLKTMGIKLTTGRFFEPEKFNEANNIVINETFARQLGGIESAMGLMLENGEKKYTVTGVCSDFLFESFRTEIEPLVIRYNPDWANNLLIKTVPGKGKEVSESLNNFLKSKSDAPFKISPMDVLISNLYETEAAQQSLLLLFGLLTIVISCLGLLGMTIFITENRTKEIGIRKVNGAKVSEILTMLNKDFVKWVVISFVIATPVAYYAMNKWLENFAYKTTLSWWIFALAGLLALGIALLTVSFQSYKAASRNPVESLRYE